VAVEVANTTTDRKKFEISLLESGLLYRDVHDDSNHSCCYELDIGSHFLLINFNGDGSYMIPFFIKK